MTDMFYKRGVEIPHFVPVETVQIRVIEPVPDQTPAVAEDLFPFLGSDHASAHTVEFQFAVDFLFRLGVYDAEAATLCVEQFLAVS